MHVFIKVKKDQLWLESSAFSHVYGVNWTGLLYYWMESMSCLFFNECEIIEYICVVVCVSARYCLSECLVG